MQKLELINLFLLLNWSLVRRFLGGVATESRGHGYYIPSVRGITNFSCSLNFIDVYISSLFS